MNERTTQPCRLSRDVSCLGFRLEWKTANTRISSLVASYKIANGNFLTIARLSRRYTQGNLRNIADPLKSLIDPPHQLGIQSTALMPIPNASCRQFGVRLGKKSNVHDKLL